jgi:hypothetical protein
MFPGAAALAIRRQRTREPVLSRCFIAALPYRRSVLWVASAKQLDANAAVISFSPFPPGSGLQELGLRELNQIADAAHS